MSQSEGTHTATSEEKDYSALFDTNMTIGSMESDDDFGRMNDKRRKRALTMYGSPSNGPCFDGPVYFGLAQVFILKKVFYFYFPGKYSRPFHGYCSTTPALTACNYAFIRI